MEFINATSNQNETIDALIFRTLGYVEGKMVAAVFEHNPHLLKYKLFLASGTEVKIPLNVPLSMEEYELWD